MSQRAMKREIDEDEFATGPDLVYLSSSMGKKPLAKRRQDATEIQPIKGARSPCVALACRKKPNTMPKKLNRKEARFLSKTLVAILHLLQNGRLSREASDSGGGIRVFVLPKEPGAEITEYPWKPGDEDESSVKESGLVLTQEQRSRLATLAKGGMLAVALAWSEIVVKEGQTRTLIVLNPEENSILHMSPFLSAGVLEQASAALMDVLLGTTKSEEQKPLFLPAELVIDTLDLYRYIRYAFSELGVRVRYEKGYCPLQNARIKIIGLM